jgi:hypothetical protein
VRKALCLALLLALLLPSLAVAAALDVTWLANTETDLAGYRVYWGTAPGVYGTPATLGKVTAHQLTGLLAGKTYYIALTAYDTSGNESGFSTEISADTGDQVAPGPPMGGAAKRPPGRVSFPGGL